MAAAVSSSSDSILTSTASPLLAFAVGFAVLYVSCAPVCNLYICCGLSLAFRLPFVVPLTVAITEAADLLEKLSLDSQTKAAAILEPAKKGMPVDNGSVMYHQGYGYIPYGTYPSPNSAVPSLGHDGQIYGLQNYHYPGPLYQPPSSAGMVYSPNQTIPSQGTGSSNKAENVPLSVGTAIGSDNVMNAGSVNRSDRARPFRPSNQKSSSNLSFSHKSPAGYNSSGYYNPGYGYDAYPSPMTWFDASIFSNGPSKYATGSRLSSPLDTYPAQTTSGFMNLMYPNHRMYGQYGNRASAAFGSFGSNSWTNGRGWEVVDNKYKSRGRGYGNENVDGLSELNRGPRAKGFKNQKELGAVTQAVGQNIIPTEVNVEDDLAQIPDKEQYNKEEFPEDYPDAKFFVIKSYSEDDVHKSIKYNIWSSTPSGNKKLDAAYNQAKENGCPVFLFFSVNASGQFAGLAEMVGPVDFNRSVHYWQQDKWIGCFPVKWHIIKDIPNSSLRHITLENNENKPVTNSRDTQEVSDSKPGDDLTDHKDAGAAIGKNSLQNHPEAALINGEVKLLEENGSGAGVQRNSSNDSKSILSSENGAVSNVVASAC
ncbi:hypothetical protein Tsubulata_016342 [Turnera subulata]|uniref:YTH domain-containing family protein n=1 Tax=Turnera subulata TaxID=218843 RepID=A0A9Q0F453_9ROSI|nr:hypothetical protein Tsubulata_016342 [Turnera subulata]